MPKKSLQYGKKWSKIEKSPNPDVCYVAKGGRMFQVGDKVVHPMHGAGVIDSIVEEKNRWNDAGILCFSHVCRRPCSENPCCEQPGHRPARRGGRGGGGRVIAALGSLEIEVTSNWNKRYRENLERLKSGDLYEVARVIKCLMRRDAQRGLSNGERKMLPQCKADLYFRDGAGQKCPLQRYRGAGQRLSGGRGCVKSMFGLVKKWLARRGEEPFFCSAVGAGRRRLLPDGRAEQAVRPGGRRPRPGAERPGAEPRQLYS